MSTGADLTALDRMLEELGARLAGVRDDRGRRDALRLVFGVNHELGRIARANPPLRETLVAVQGHLNAVTIAVKRGKMDDANLEMGLASESFVRVKDPANLGKNL